MTSSEIRQSFLDFFKSKQHTIVPSSSLMPDSPNLLFTNAGMNQFVPIFLGQTKCPYAPPRAADTQKCIRAGGKHNDLDDVGLDTYHHTFFEMLGNWSFGDYFKKEAIDWAWELITEVWKFPKERLYATVYSPDKSKGDPSEFDQEAYDFWAAKFTVAGLDPKVHIVYGNKKDNFWMMGETGPCGPCSELHVDLTPQGDTKGALVNKGSADCIEIWNLVFIQFNANPDGTFSPLPARHVDTGMGFERASSIIQCTKKFTDFTGIISNYETDIFRPIFDRLEKMSGKKYTSTLPAPAGAPGPGEHTRPRVLQTAPSRSASPTSNTPEAKYSHRNLPHFERPWAKYMVTFSTLERRQLTPSERDLVLSSILYAHEHRQYELYAACVMPDHVHLIFEPQVKEKDAEGKPVFWSLSEILQGVKSASAHQINKASGGKGGVWEKESMDRMIRGDADMQEKFHYVCRNPWDAGIVAQTENYPWLWTPDVAAWKEGAPVESVSSEPTAGAQSATREGACAPRDREQEKIDVAFRVIADHIRTLSFAIADGIQPGNNDRNYVLRRILRRAVRYGRTLGFHEPFFYKLVDVLADMMGDVFPEIRAKKMHVQETIRREEEAFNKTLDRGIALFEEEIAHLGSAPAPGAADRALAVGTEPSHNLGVKYSKRRLPHFERPWGKYMVTFTTHQKRQLSPAERDIVLESILYAHKHHQYQLFAACVMPDHVHILFEPQIKEQDKDGKPIFFPLGEIMHGIKSTTAHKINKAAKVAGVHVWEEDSFDRLMRGDSDLEEKFHYICRNPWDNGLASHTENYRWLWTPDAPVAGNASEVSREGAGNSARGGRAPREGIVTGEFAFKLYDTYGFPIDLTELMARERGLTVDKSGFDRLMDEQKSRARAAQKKEVISLSQIETTAPTKFVGYEQQAAEATVLEVVKIKDKAAIILDTTPFYAEMGGQVGDAGWLIRPDTVGMRVDNTTKSGSTYLHWMFDNDDLVEVGTKVTAQLNWDRRPAINRHHTVTHLLHWALHEVVSKEATQKGSFVGPDKLTFDFNTAALTPEQVADIEKLVNEKILENAGVSWTEVPHVDVKSRKDVMQFFGDKYGDMVRVVQIGGTAHKLDGYSMELCGGTHTRATGEIGLFRIVSEAAVAAGVRRIEAVAGLEAYRKANDELHLIKTLAGKVNSPVHELEKKIESMLAQQKETEKLLKAAVQRNAAQTAAWLKTRAETVNGIPLITQYFPDSDGDYLQVVVDSLKGQFQGVVVLGGAMNGNAALIASVSAEFTAKAQAGKIIQVIAPIVGGKGGGKPDNARGGGKDVAKLSEALTKVKSILGG